ncbi:oligo-1,6-glucosidase [Reticulibacter mediterranei]|uniref:Oligo-1,6-glucosidase n=1 Tax=Reticulibacter mediterranei TaxID=2778369 RepID=A0A8J3IFK3_9CHLR|nr:alpha-amylase family glycosyl hydrolase [Reticulibacter mediterranei]GHO93596.1 oligo-1,6-glucosidase [Reticulibacter mediterranei]
MQPSWWQTGVIYQIYPRSFLDTNGDGIGDLPGITKKLDYLQWLGVDILWLSPIFPSPMADFGYDISNYCDIDPLFGTLQELDVLVEQAHRRGLKLVLDFVPNHTSDEHPWFQESRSSRENEKRDWYIWHDPAPDGGPPNNWTSFFGGSAWELDAQTGQYYLHMFDVKQPDLNWHNPQVRQAMYDVLRFWLDRGIDGFRVDVLWLLMKDEQLRDNPINPDWRPGDLPEQRQFRLYNEDQPGVHAIVREMRSVLDTYGERVLIGEIYLPIERLVHYYGESLDEAHLPFNFQLFSLPGWEAAILRQVIDTYESLLPAGAWPNWVLSNHDRPRIATRIGKAQARVAQMLLLTLRGTPTCYYGDELGMENVLVPLEMIHDPQGKEYPALSRDHARTPMQWDTSANAGFSSSHVTPWLPVSEDYRTNNVSVSRKNIRSFLMFTRTLIELRRLLPALKLGSYQSIEQDNPSCFVYQRGYQKERYLVVLNLSDEKQVLSLTGKGRVLLTTYMDFEGTRDLAELYLRGNEGLLIEIL